eukprot:m.135775 g.135775  ORF g.135775 m.135775 type:complete len:80 (+) comp38166_c0_seq2:352-591(+)
MTDGSFSLHNKASLCKEALKGALTSYSFLWTNNEREDCLMAFPQSSMAHVEVVGWLKCLKYSGVQSPVECELTQSMMKP